MPDQDIAFAQESAATGETAKRMARATLGFTTRRTRFRVHVAVVVLLMSAANFLLYEGDGLSPRARIFGSVFWGAVLTLVVFLVFGALGYVANCRSFRRTVPPARCSAPASAATSS